MRAILTLSGAFFGVVTALLCWAKLDASRWSWGLLTSPTSHIGVRVVGQEVEPSTLFSEVLSARRHADDACLNRTFLIDFDLAITA